MADRQNLELIAKTSILDAAISPQEQQTSADTATINQQVPPGPAICETKLDPLVDETYYEPVGVTRAAGGVIMVKTEPEDVRYRNSEYYMWFGVGRRARYRIVQESGPWMVSVCTMATTSDDPTYLKGTCLFRPGSERDAIYDLHERMGESDDPSQELVDAYRAEFVRLIDLAFAAVAAHDGDPLAAIPI